MSTSYSWEGKGRYGSFRLRMNVWVCTVQLKLWNPLRTHAIPKRFCGGDSLRRGAISNVWTFTFTFKCVGGVWPTNCHIVLFKTVVVG